MVKKSDFHCPMALIKNVRFMKHNRLSSILQRAGSYGSVFAYQLLIKPVGWVEQRETQQML